MGRHPPTGGHIIEEVRYETTAFAGIAPIFIGADQETSRLEPHPTK